MTDPAMPPDLDRLLGAATVPAMSADLIDRIVAEAQRPGRVAMSVAPPRRANARAWTRRGVRSGIVAVSLMLATAVAAAFGGGALSVAKIRAVAQHVVERIRHPFHHAVPVAVHTVHRMTVPATAIRIAPATVRPGFAPHAFVAPVSLSAGPVPGRAFAQVPPRTAASRAFAGERPHPLSHVRARFAGAHPFAHRPAVRPAGFPHAQREPLSEPRPEPRIEPHVPDVAPIEPRSAPAPIAPIVVTPTQGLRGDGLQADGGRRFDGPRWRDPSRFGAGQGQRNPGWRARMQGAGGAGGQGWRRRAGQGGGMRPKPFRPGGGVGRRPRRF